MATTIVTVRPNGSLKVTGPARVILVDGSAVEIPDGVTRGLCRCGNSANKPYCDGTHRQVGWADPPSDAGIPPAG
jgi:CDGSH-type Zn-finger protein